MDDLLLTELRKFECELDEAELYAHAEALIRALRKCKKDPSEFHVEVVSAKRKLLGAIESENGCAAYCEALLRLLRTKHSREFTTTAELLDALETCLLWLERQLAKDLGLDLAALFPLFSAVFEHMEEEELGSAHALITRAAQLAMGLFAGKLDCELGLPKVWRALVGLFRLCGEDSQQMLLDELHQAAVAKCSLEPKALASFPVYLVESTGGGGDVKIDFVSLLALSLLQCGKGSQLVPRFVEVLVKQYQAANQVANKADRNKSWSVWMKLLAKDCLAVLRCPEFPLAEQLAHTLATRLCDNPLDDYLAAIEVVAMVLAALERDSQIKDEFAVPKPAPEALAAAPRLEDVVNSQETMACPCKTGFTNQFLIDCFRCHRWFHGKCVGVDSQQPELHLLAFTCSDCQVYAVVESAMAQQQQQGEGGEAGLRTEEQIKLRERALIARHLWSKRKSDMLYSLALNSYDGVGGGNGGEDAGGEGHHLQPLTRGEASKLHRMVAHLGQWNLKQRQRYLGAMLKTLRLAESAFTRCHAIRQLAVVFEANPVLFENARVKLAMGERLEDKSILVREACLDLVAKSVHSHEYRAVVLNSAHDDGVSVRKRAIKLISDIILREDEEDASPVLIQFSMRLDDFKEEEAVKTTVRNALHQFFLKASARKINLALLKMSQQYISFAWLEASLLDGKLQGKFRSCCELAMDQLGSPDADKLACIKLCRVLAKFLTTAELKRLVAYIAPKPAEEVAFAVCEIFVLRGEAFALELGKEMDTLSVSGNLQKLVMGCKPETLPSVVKAISSLRLVNLCAWLWKTFTAFLEQPETKQVDHCQRAILVLSLLMRYCGFPPDYVSRAAQLILPYAHPSRDVRLRKYSLQASAWLLVRNTPDQYEAISSHIYPLLHRDSEPELKVRALDTLYDILIESDDQTGKSESEVSLLTNVVTRRLSDYLLLLKDPCVDVRRAAVHLLRPLLKRQTVHPQQVAAPLLALLRDSQLHDTVLDALREAHERNKISSALLYQGILESHAYSHADLAGGEQLGCFSDAYFLFMGNVRNERKVFLSQLVNAAFDKPESAHFLCQVLARLPYQSYFEVVLVVQLLRKRGVLLASGLRHKLDGVFGPVLKDSTGATGADVAVSDSLRLDCASSVHVSFALCLAKYLVKQYRVSNAVLQQNAADNKTMLSDELTAHQQQLANKPLEAVSFAFAPDQFSSLKDWSRAYSHLIRAMMDGGDEYHRGAAVEDGKPRRKRASKAVADEAEDDEAEQVAATPHKPRPKRAKPNA